MVSRPLAFLLAIALLFQMSWAVAATYCGHDTSPKAASHLGHHAHVHPASGAKHMVADTLAADDDCGDCHAVHAAIVPIVPTVVASDATVGVERSRPSRHGSAPARAPDRPQWLRLA